MKNHNKGKADIWKWFIVRSFILDSIITTSILIYTVLKINHNLKIFYILKAYSAGFIICVLIILMYDSYKESIIDLKKLSLKNRIIVIILFLISLYFVILKIIRDYNRM